MAVWLQSSGCQFLPTIEWLRGQLSRIRSVAGYFSRMLERTQARVGFVNTYYSAEGMAFILACRKHGVAAIDIQHGMQGHKHVAYGCWRNMLASGYELLPNQFWVWSQTEADAISAWRPSAMTDHVPIVVGNPWRQLWLGDGEPFVRETLAQVAEAIDASHAKRHVLVTLTRGVEWGEDAKILRALALLGRDYMCWIRPHPAAMHEAGRVREEAKRFGVANFDIERSAQFPLYALMPRMSVNVTHSSTTVLEAESFGVPSVVTSDYGLDFFRDKLDSGTARAALTTESIAEAIAQSCDMSAARRTTVPMGNAGSIEAGFNALGLSS